MKLTSATVLLTMFFSTSAFSEMDSMKNLTKEQRETMASMHEKMATCLRSDRSPEECHKEMKDQCNQMGPEQCPMMGKMDKMKHKAKGSMNKAKAKVNEATE